MSKVVGKVTAIERDTIQSLYERKNGLLELAKVIQSNDELYEKMVMDLGSTSTKFQSWWDEMSAKYQWESRPNGNWRIVFETCEILLD